MRVDPRDGRCRSCSGELTIIDADDATMTVECQNPACGKTYFVEPDAFGDGCMTYYVGFMAKHVQEGGDPDAEDST
jgi:hypothetical protein